MEGKPDLPMCADELESEPRTLWISRHGNRVDFMDPTWRRSASRPEDPPLSPDGVEQARELGHRLAGEGIAHVFASPFLRAVQTASCVAEAVDAPIRIEHGVCEWLNREWFAGVPEYLSDEEMARLFPRVVCGYRSAVFPRYPETWDEMEARTCRR